MSESYGDALLRHYRHAWGQIFQRHQWKFGPMRLLDSEFCVLEFPPTDTRGQWMYATCGMSRLANVAIELHVYSDRRCDELIELMTIVAHYHVDGSALGLHHTVNFGRPWYPGSACEYGFISLPYLDDESFEVQAVEGRTVQFLWLIPITRAERDFKAKYGVQALEECFEASDIDFANPFRTGVLDTPMA